jgi:hypothetical protein
MRTFTTCSLCCVLLTLGAACVSGADASTSVSATAAAAVDPPPQLQVLVDDDQWNTALAQQVAAEPPPGPDHADWLGKTMFFSAFARAFPRGERCARALVALEPGNWQWHDQLSWFLGKEGKYQEALDEATTAAGMAGADQMHLAAISASWLWHLGRHDQARARFAAIVEPAHGDDAWPDYQACRACFAASSHDQPTMQDAITKIIPFGGMHVLFLKRDVIFDQYRGEKWFRALLGDTLAPPGKDLY